MSLVVLHDFEIFGFYLRNLDVTLEQLLPEVLVLTNNLVVLLVGCGLLPSREHYNWVKLSKSFLAGVFSLHLTHRCKKILVFVLLSLVHKFDVLGLICKNLGHVLVTKHCRTYLDHLCLEFFITCLQTLTVLSPDHALHFFLKHYVFLLDLKDLSVFLRPISLQLDILLLSNFLLLFCVVQ